MGPYRKSRLVILGALVLGLAVPLVVQAQPPSLAARVSALEAAVASLQAALATETAARQAADAAEATVRANADAAFQEGLAAEIAARQVAINAEAATRANADSALQAAVNSETAARQAADTALQNALSAQSGGYEVVKVDSPNDNQQSKGAQAICPPGKRPVGGGVGVSGPPDFHYNLWASWPSDASGLPVASANDRWVAFVHTSEVPGENVWFVQAVAICAVVGP